MLQAIVKVHNLLMYKEITYKKNNTYGSWFSFVFLHDITSSIIPKMLGIDWSFPLPTVRNDLPHAFTGNLLVHDESEISSKKKKENDNEHESRSEE